MSAHTVADILDAAAAWVWLPRDSEQVNEQVQLVRYPPRFGGGVRASQVRSSLEARALVELAVERTRAWEESHLTFWTSPSDSPGVEEELRRRGGRARRHGRRAGPVDR